MGIFDDALTNAVHALSLDGGPDEQEGDASEGAGWRGLLRGVESSELWLYARENGDELSAEDCDLVDHSAGCILSVDTAGNIGAQWYETAAELTEAWREECDAVNPPECRIVTDWENGNREDVANAFAALDGVRAAALALKVADIMEGADLAKLARYLDRKAER